MHPKPMKTIIASCLGLLLCGISISAQETGLKIGSKAPEFSLKDQNGKETTLNSLLKKGKVALVFYRSADW